MASRQTLVKFYKKHMVTGEAPRRITEKYVIAKGYESLADFYDDVGVEKDHHEAKENKVKRQKKVQYDRERYLQKKKKRERELEESKYEKRVVRMMCYSFDTASKKQQEAGITHHMYAHEITSFS